MHRLQDSVFSHEHEISLASSVDDILRTGTLAYEGADIVREAHDLIDTDTSPVSCHTTLATSLAVIERVGILFGRETCYTDILQHVADDVDLTCICLIRLTTVGTYTSHETLRYDDIET